MKKIKNNEIIDYVLSISKNINIKEDTDESISSDFNYDMDSINSLNCG